MGIHFFYSDRSSHGLTPKLYSLKQYSLKHKQWVFLFHKNFPNFFCKTISKIKFFSKAIFLKISDSGRSLQGTEVPEPILNFSFPTLFFRYTRLSLNQGEKIIYNLLTTIRSRSNCDQTNTDPRYLFA